MQIMIMIKVRDALTDRPPIPAETPLSPLALSLSLSLSISSSRGAAAAAAAAATGPFRSVPF